ncbi:unnamed protein product [Urochloa humidicola]
MEANRDIKIVFKKEMWGTFTTKYYSPSWSTTESACFLCEGEQARISKQNKMMLKGASRFPRQQKKVGFTLGVLDISFFTVRVLQAVSQEKKKKKNRVLVRLTYSKSMCRREAMERSTHSTSAPWEACARVYLQSQRQKTGGELMASRRPWQWRAVARSAISSWEELGCDNGLVVGGAGKVEMPWVTVIWRWWRLASEFRWRRCRVWLGSVSKTEGEED